VILAVAVLAALRIFLPRGNSDGAAGDDDFSRYHNETFTCVKVIDGDTIDIGIADNKSQKHTSYTRVRLWGIDTPELPHHGQAAMYYGYEAAEFARTLMQGKRVKLELVAGETRDYYGRLLAYVYLADGWMYSREAIRSGFAYADRRYRHSRQDEFCQLEAEARANLVGLWAGVQPDQLPKWYRQAALKSFWTDRQAKPGSGSIRSSQPIDSSAVLHRSY